MNDRDSINLEQAYAHANMRRQILAEMDDMSERIIENYHEQLVAEGVLEEGVWDSIKSGASKVAGAVGGAYQSAKGAVTNKLYLPLVKMVQQKFPEAWAELKQMSPEQLKRAMGKSAPSLVKASADPYVTESLYYYCRTINEDAGKDYPLDDLWAEANRVEDQCRLENAWSVFDEMVNEASPQRGGTALTPPDHNAPAAKRYTGSVRKDVMTLKKDVKEFLDANPKMAGDGRFKQIEDLVANLDREGRAKNVGTGTPPVVGPSDDVEGTDAPIAGPDGEELQQGGDVPPVLNQPETTPAPTDSGSSGGMISRAWNWIKNWTKQNPGKAMTAVGLLGLFAFVGLTPVTLLGLIRGVGTGIAHGAAMADPDVGGMTSAVDLVP